MFTGIVKEIGRIERIETGEQGARIAIAASFVPELNEGDSVAIEGVCLTVATLGEGAFEADVMNQSLSLTTLGSLEAGSGVNLEPALRAGDPLGGHIVQGHVDGLGELTELAEDGFARRLRIALPGELRPYVIERGSVTVAGVSLTVAGLSDDGLEVSLVPETLQRTTLGRAVAGAKLNMEIDPIARYVESLLTRFQAKE